MMDYNQFLNGVPLVGVLLGTFLLIMLLTNRKAIRERRARNALLIFILSNIHYQIDSFFTYGGLEDSNYVGYSYLYYHLSGMMIYLFTAASFKLKYKRKPWLIGLVLYTFVRILIIAIHEVLYYKGDIAALTEFYDIVVIDYYLAILVNLFFLIAALVQLRQAHFAVKLSSSEAMTFRMIKSLLLVSTIIYLAIFQSALISAFFEESELLFLKIETLINSFIFFALTYYAIRFPLFSVHGDFKDLPSTESVKYARSSLNENSSETLWNKIHECVEHEQVYHNPEYRLNDLAEACDSSVHHVSQVINEQKGMSFTDFINQYRIAEAKLLLNGPEAQKLTILAIAYEVGFNSKTAFYNAFKKHTGTTPSAFKKNPQNT